MLRITHWVCFFIVCVSLIGCQPNHKDMLHQIAPVSQLIQGEYDGVMAYSQVKRYGDFGVGTFHKIEGEMVAVSGNFYQIKANGTVTEVLPGQTTPYATVHYFDAQHRFLLNNADSFDVLSNKLIQRLPSRTLLYGVKITGIFKAIKLRSPHAQNKPYLGLKDVIKNQAIFDRKNIEGTLVGYVVPGHLSQIIVSGVHFHFIAKDRKSGGHVLDVSVQDAVVELDPIHSLHVHLFDRPKVDTNVLFQGE